MSASPALPLLRWPWAARPSSSPPPPPECRLGSGARPPLSRPSTPPRRRPSAAPSCSTSPPTWARARRRSTPRSRRPSPRRLPTRSRAARSRRPRRTPSRRSSPTRRRAPCPPRPTARAARRRPRPERRLVQLFGRRRATEAAHQLLDELARLGVGHQPLLHLLGGSADLRVGHEALRHGLEARRHVPHRGLLCDLDQDGLTGRGRDRLRLCPHHLDPFAAKALALEPAVTELRPQAIQRRVELGEVDGSRHGDEITTRPTCPRTWPRPGRGSARRPPCA